MQTPQSPCRRHSTGFSRTELLATLAACGVVSALLLPLTAGAGAGAQAVGCLENLRRLGLAWQLYAQDGGGRLVNNYDLPDTLGTVNSGTFRTWAHNVLDWTRSPANTNLLWASRSRLFPYLDPEISVFRCSADTLVSPAQQRLGWTGRVRSYSMNAFLGALHAAPSSPSLRGENPYVPGYRQFLLSSSIPGPSETAVFLDEHPDSINDGLFLNSPAVASQWGDLPGSLHEGGMGISYADGGAEIHHWAFPSTRKPVRFIFPPNTAIPSAERDDYRWLARRLSVEHGTLGVTRQPGDQVRFIWSQTPANLTLQSASSLTSGQWTDLPGVPERSLGQSVVTLPAPAESTVYRLVRP